MRRLHLILALMLALSLPLQGLAASLAHECVPQPAGIPDHDAHGDHAMPMPDADSAHDCCGEPCNCPVQDACAAPAGAAVMAGWVTTGFLSPPGAYTASPVNSPQTAHRIPLNRPPIAS